MTTPRQLTALFLASALPAAAGDPAPTTAASPASSAPDAWTRFNDWGIAGILFPALHIHGVGGASSTDPESLAGGGHDPSREAFSAQAVEPGVSIRTKYLEAFANHIFYQDAGGAWDNEWEEAFAKLTNLPGGFEIKGGQFLPHLGALNDKHLHAWDFVDSETVLSRFLGEHGLLIQGAELNWTLPFNADPVFVSVASLGYGDAREHSHGGHHHGPAEPPHEGGEAAPATDILTARWMARYRFDDFKSVTAGLSWADGTNGFNLDTRLFGIDAEYLWRENGLEPGGRALRLRSELLWRDVDAHSEHDEDGDGVIDISKGDEIFSGNYRGHGMYAHAIYTWNPRLDTALRIGWTEGVDDFGQDGRFRVSPAVSYWFDSGRRVGLRAQYNYDHLAGGRDGHAVWFQFNLSLGSGNEVR